MIAPMPFVDLVFVYMPGCGACEAAMPEIDAFMDKHPEILVVKARADGPIALRLLGSEVKATPTYVLRRGREGFVHEGAMKAKDVEKWIKKVTESDDDADAE